MGVLNGKMCKSKNKKWLVTQNNNNKYTLC